MCACFFFFSHPSAVCAVAACAGTTARAWMAERSKALDSSSSIFGCVGSNPTPSILDIFGWSAPLRGGTGPNLALGCTPPEGHWSSGMILL